MSAAMSINNTSDSPVEVRLNDSSLLSAARINLDDIEFEPGLNTRTVIETLLKQNTALHSVIKALIQRVEKVEKKGMLPEVKISGRSKSAKTFNLKRRNIDDRPKPSSQRTD